MVCFISIGITLGQESQIIALNEPLQFRLQAGEASFFTYSAPKDEILNISVISLESDNPQDSVIEILDAKGNRLAYQDDSASVDENGIPINLEDAIIHNFAVPENSELTFRVDTFSHATSGTVELLLTSGDLFQQTIAETEEQISIQATFPENRNYTYTFAGRTDEILTITARDTSNSLDLTVTLFNEDGAVIAFNDDHDSSDLSLNIFDSQIAEVIIPDNGMLQIIVKDFLGSEGTFELVINRLEAEN
jgi:hypothetical protein